MKRRGFLGGIAAGLAGLLCKPALLMADDPVSVTGKDIVQLGNGMLRGTDWLVDLDDEHNGEVLLWIGTLNRQSVDNLLQLHIRIPAYIMRTLSTKELKLILWGGMKCAMPTHLLSTTPPREAIAMRCGKKILLAYRERT